jgi:uncharacterized protein (TIGR03083 family)
MTTDAVSADQKVVDQLEEVWARIVEFGSGLSEDEWKRPTEVPGWTVQDNLAHLTDIEAMILERPPPNHAVAGDPPHVKNDAGRRNEVFVDARRSWSGAEALAEFREVTRARLAQLRASTDDDFAADSWTPIGPGTVRDLLPFRVFDAWVHEQDMRRAVDRPGGLGGAAAEASMDRVIATAPFVVGKKAGAPDGTVVVIECTPPLARTVAISVIDRRARPMAEMPAAPTVRITMDGETYARLACGRTEPAAALAAGSVRLTGDEALGRRIVEELNFLF